MSKYAEFKKKAVELGALGVKVVPASAVVTAPWVRWKCQYGCEHYGKKLTCPPHSPGVEETGRLLACYRRALLVRTGVCRDARKIAAELEKELFLSGFYKAFALAAGPCGLCRTCGETCAHPGQARPSMEACGIDVFATARRAGFPIQVVTSRSSSQNCYALILIE